MSMAFLTMIFTSSAGTLQLANCNIIWLFTQMPAILALYLFWSLVSYKLCLLQPKRTHGWRHLLRHNTHREIFRSVISREFCINVVEMDFTKPVKHGFNNSNELKPLSIGNYSTLSTSIPRLAFVPPWCCGAACGSFFVNCLPTSV